MEKPFRIVISIYRGTSAGRALSLMASGAPCCAASYDDAKKIVDDYCDAASAVLSGASSVCFGITAIVNEITNKVDYCNTLVGFAGK